MGRRQNFFSLAHTRGIPRRGPIARTPPAVAPRYGIGKLTVLRLLKDTNVPMRRQPITPNQTVQAVVLYKAGKSLTAVARELGLAQQSVRLALLRAEVAMRPSGGPRTGQPPGDAPYVHKVHNLTY